MQHIPIDIDIPSKATASFIPLKPPSITSVRITDSVQLKVAGDLPISLTVVDSIGLREIALPAGPFDRSCIYDPSGMVAVQSTAGHRLDASERWSDARELQGQIERQHSTCITIQAEAQSHGFIIPQQLCEGATVVAVSWPSTQGAPMLSLYEFRDGLFRFLPAKVPDEGSGIMHATQNLSHINEGLKVLKSASDTGAADISLVVPSVERSKLLTEALPPAVAQKVSGWTYVEDGNKNFTTNFSDPFAMESIVGFLGCNLELAKRVRRGEFKVLASDFRAEPQILALLNPDVILAGYNYTFLSGRLKEYASGIGEHPLRSLLLDTAESLEAFSGKLLTEGASNTSCEWWDLTSRKLGGTHRRLDALAYRTLRHDPDLPRTVQGIPVIQVPHPVAPLTISREKARDALAAELGFNPKTAKVVVVPGLSDDGQFERRLQTLARIVSNDPDIIMVSPLESGTLAKICGVSPGSPRVHGIGFREKWGEVLVACDAAIIRGSWGEILDCIRAGVVPIFSSPGIIEAGSSRPRELFLQEVLGERAMNLALLFEALEKEGIVRSLLKDLIVGASNDDSALESAINRATTPEMTLAVQATFKRIRRDGVDRLVDVYGWLKKIGRKPELNEIDSFSRQLWGNV